MRFPLLLTITALMLQGCERPLSEPRVEVRDASVQLPLVRGRPGTAYFTLETNSRPMHLVSVSSPQVRRIELHDSASEGGVMRMMKLDNPPFERDEMTFAPGGKHAMLFGIDRKVKAGGTVTLTFTFDPAPPVTVEAKVTKAGAGNAEQASKSRSRSAA